MPRATWSLLVVTAALGLACQRSTPAPAENAALLGPVASRVEVAVTERGFVPNRIPAKKGQLLTLAITRKTDQTCAHEIVFEDQPRKTPLPLNQTVEVAYTPSRSGEVKFGCAMGMMIRGMLQVRD